MKRRQPPSLFSRHPPTSPWTLGPDKPNQLRSRSRPRPPFIKPAGPRRAVPELGSTTRPSQQTTRPAAPCPLGFAAAPR
ncbi:hypothetical protein PAHAL_1G398700 [Panicum hallii]|uniref:Uncharacterized protein n=1 Tax=Panicum hallii TaxID=206008 RepID=A0A2T8KXR7_9POAL|nr:hypothetical protein PAHAL_1G398700 [Panicum hallii]